jgi:hypothetical protein
MRRSLAQQRRHNQEVRGDWIICGHGGGWVGVGELECWSVKVGAAPVVMVPGSLDEESPLELRSRVACCGSL